MAYEQKTEVVTLLAWHDMIWYRKTFCITFFLSINVVVSQAKPRAGVLRTNKGERWWSGNSVPDVSDHWRLPQVLASRPTVLDGHL